MTTESTKELIRRYTDLLNEAVDSYYHHNTSLMSDDAFNELYNTLSELEKQHPSLVCTDSPIRTVGSDLDETSDDQVTYQVPMLSITTKTDSGITPAENFISRMQKLLPGEVVEIIAEPKYDGLAVNARYIDSRLVSLSTRGNKFVGENVTYNTHLVQRLPQSLPEMIPGVVDVRGEVVLPTSLMYRANEVVFAQWQKNYATPRHMASALLRSKTPPPETLLKPLVFLAYGIGQSDNYHPDSQKDLLCGLRSMGFETYDYLCDPTTDPQILYNYHQHLYRVRDRLGYEIDGVVYKVNSIDQQRRLGVSGKEPRWAIAHKFPTAAKASVVLDIQYQVGKTGSLTPVVYIDPVEISGILVQKLSAHNLFELRRKRIKVGASVMIELAGDVIPQITMTLPSTSYRLNPKSPSTCPSCASPVIRPKGAAKHQCTNTVNCPPQLVARILYFAGRDCADLDSLGEKTVQDLVTHCGISHPYDLFTLTAETMGEKLPKYSSAKIARILRSIKEPKHLQLSKILQGLSIPGLGAATATVLAENLPDLSSLPRLPASELQTRYGVDSAASSGIEEHFRVITNAQKYLALLLRLTDRVPTEPVPQPKVYNKRHYDVPPDAVYIGRPTKWGNPFSHLPGKSLAQHKTETREEAVQKFETYLLGNSTLLEAAKTELRGKSLVCWCAPKSCHGDILMKYANM